MKEEISEDGKLLRNNKKKARKNTESSKRNRFGIISGWKFTKLIGI